MRAVLGGNQLTQLVVVHLSGVNPEQPGAVTLYIIHLGGQGTLGGLVVEPAEEMATPQVFLGVLEQGGKATQAVII